MTRVTSELPSPLHNIPSSTGAFYGTELYLKMLLLEGNKLGTIPEPVLQLPVLSNLDLSLNDIYEVPPEKVPNVKTDSSSFFLVFLHFLGATNYKAPL